MTNTWQDAEADRADEIGYVVPKWIVREYKQLVLALCDYLNTEHASYFAKPVTPQTLKRWAGRGLCELNEASLDEAIQHKRIPPRRGRPKVPEVEDENLSD